jgi:hypothetical protein
MRAITILLLISCIAGCQIRPKSQPATQATAEEAPADRWRATDEAVVNTLTEGIGGARNSPRYGVTHVVLCWLKTPGDEVQRKRLIEVSHSFSAIPGVSLIAAGTSLPSTRPVVDSTYDVGIVIMFEDEAALRAYDAHSLHRKAVEETLRPLTQKIQIYDFRNIRP